MTETLETELVPITHWDGESRAYEVRAAGVTVGVVQQCYPTFERAPRGATYVTKRWRAKRPYWEYRIGESSRASIDYPTRKRAIEVLLRDAAERARDSRRMVETEGLHAKHD